MIASERRILFCRFRRTLSEIFLNFKMRFLYFISQYFDVLQCIKFS